MASLDTRTALGQDTTEMHLLPPSAAQAKQRTKDVTTGLFDDLSIWSRLAPIAVILLQLCVFLFLLLVIPCAIWLSPVGPLSTTNRTLYTTGVTIIASLIAAFTASQIRTLWLRDILTGHSLTGTLSDRDVKKARVVLLIVTAAIVGGTTASIEGHQSLSFGTIYRGPNISNLESPSPGTSSNDSNQFPWFVVTEGPNPATPSWPKANGSYLGLNGSATDTGGPLYFSNAVLNLLRDPTGTVLSTFNPPEVCGVLGGGALGCAALGVPLGLGGLTSSFVSVFGTETQLTDASLCVPVIYSNPVHCHAIQSFDPTNFTGVVLTQTGPGLGLYSLVITNTDEQRPGAAIVTIHAAATEDYANALLALVQPKNGPPPQSEDDYTVQCEISLSPSIGFRRAFYHSPPDVDVSTGAGPRSSAYISSTADVTRVNNVFYNYNSQICDPGAHASTVSSLDSAALRSLDSTYQDIILTHVSQVQSDVDLATGASLIFGLFQQMSFGVMLSFISSPSGLTIDYSEYNFAFQDSKNQLGDILGVVLGLGMSLYWGQGVPAADRSIAEQPRYSFPVVKIQHAERIGSGSWAAIIYSLPSAFTIVLLMILLKRRDPNLLSDARASWKMRYMKRR